VDSNFGPEIDLNSNEFPWSDIFNAVLEATTEDEPHALRYSQALAELEMLKQRCEALRGCAGIKASILEIDENIRESVAEMMLELFKCSHANEDGDVEGPAEDEPPVQEAIGRIARVARAIARWIARDGKDLIAARCQRTPGETDEMHELKDTLAGMPQPEYGWDSDDLWQSHLDPAPQEPQPSPPSGEQPALPASDGPSQQQEPPVIDAELLRVQQELGAAHETIDELRAHIAGRDAIIVELRAELHAARVRPAAPESDG
jgi:hypothetical protein